jgi:uncharacterized membrane protein
MAEMEKSGTILRISIVFALLGFVDSLYLFYSELTGNFNCLINEGMFECSAVNTSSYAKLFGVHVSLWGMIFYIGVIIVLFLAIFQKNKYWLSFFLPIAGLWGAGFSIYLTIIEIVVIEKLCEFCLLSAICTLILFVLIIVAKLKSFPKIYSDLDFWNMFKKETN